MIKKQSVICGALIIALLSACTKVETSSEMNKPSPNSSSVNNKTSLTLADYKSVSESGVADASNKFGFKLFNELLKTDKDKNLFISPASISMALAMTYNGADAETKDAMAKTLEFNDIKLSDINDAYKNIIKILSYSDEKVKFNIANSLWSNKGIKLKSDFIKNNETNFSAKLTELDFNSPDALTTINGWVNEKTENKIPKIITKIDPATILFLINAIYFKGSWSEKFDTKSTVEQDFNLNEGKQKKVSMMNKSSSFGYYKGEKFQAVELPYGDGKFSMYLFLPDESSNLDDFYKNVNQDNWKNWLGSFSKTKGKVSIPRFKAEYDKQLNEPLENIGMEIAFTGKANFKNMIDSDVSISEVIHKTFVEVNEEGTKAAAATSVAITKNAIITSKDFSFIADRPFFTAIVEKQTGTILFMGDINTPN